MGVVYNTVINGLKLPECYCTDTMTVDMHSECDLWQTVTWELATERVLDRSRSWKCRWYRLPNSAPKIFDSLWSVLLVLLSLELFPHRLLDCITDGCSSIYCGIDRICFFLEVESLLIPVLLRCYSAYCKNLFGCDRGTASYNLLITFAKEGGYVFSSVCLSVCLHVCRITEKVVKISWRGRAWPKEQWVQFWWWSRSPSGSRSPKSGFTGFWRSAEVCLSWTMM